MPKVSKDSATQGGEYGPVTDRNDELEGYTVNFVSFAQDIDATPLLKGLPDDRCQCPHWGYVLSGQADVPLRRPTRRSSRPATPSTAARPRPDRHEPGTEYVSSAPPRS